LSTNDKSKTILINNIRAFFVMTIYS